MNEKSQLDEIRKPINDKPKQTALDELNQKLVDVPRSPYRRTFNP